MLFHVSDDAHRGINPIWVKLKKKQKNPQKLNLKKNSMISISFFNIILKLEDYHIPNHLSI